MSGGLSIGGNSPQRKIGNEFPQIMDMLRTDETALNHFVGGQPLLAGAEGLGLGFAGGLPSLTSPLMSLMGSLPSAIGGLGTGLGGLFNETGGLMNQAGGLFSSVGNLASRIPNFSALENPVMAGFRSRTAPILRSGGALTPEMERDVSTATGNLFASRGTEGGNQAIGSQLLNREQFRDQRFNEALGQAGSASNIIGGLTQEDIGLRSGIMGQQSGILGQEGQLIGEQGGLLGQGAGLLTELTGMESGLASGVQGLESGAINQLLAPEQAAVGSFTSINNPLLSYASNLFAGNQASQLQQGIANQNKGSGLVGGSGAGITSILGDLISVGAISDGRLKTNIRHTGETTPEGIPIKTFQFKGDRRGRRFMGVIAQDVAQHAPHAVGMGPDGLMRVNFSAIHAPYHALGNSAFQAQGAFSSMGSQSGNRGEGGDIHLAYMGPIAHDRNADANFALHGSGTKKDKQGRRNMLPHDIAVSPDLLKDFPLGTDVHIHGNRYHIADVSFRSPHHPNHNTIEFRDRLDHPKLSFKDIYRYPMNVGRTLAHLPSALRHGKGRHGMKLGRSGYPRAIPVGRGGRGGGDPAYGGRSYPGGPSFYGSGPGDPGGGAPDFGGFPGGGDPFAGAPGGDPYSGGGGPGGGPPDTSGGSPADFSFPSDQIDPQTGIPFFLDPNAEWMGDYSQGGDLLHLMING